MAYGVKYRLEFSDDLENGKKIEILKKNYSGSVLDLVGTDEPCIISWESDDNIYSPIKGSQCTLNLFVTDSVNYDNFYESDEREYQVKIFYKDSSNNYQLYWIGWLVVDQFKEAITTKPFPITLTAYDGLGTLDGFDMPLDQSSHSFKSGIWWIYNCLNNLDLELDIYISQDIFIRTPGTWNSLYDVIQISPYALQKSGLAINNAKFVLSQILQITNARIFQSFGKWYIINNSSYSGQTVKDASASTAQGGTVPTNIRTSEAQSLINNGTESPKFYIYNYLGVFQSSTTVNVLRQIPSNLQPIDNDLTKEYLRPLNEFIISHRTSQYLNINIIPNSGFENGLSGWTTYTSTGTTSPGELSTDFAKQGNQSFKNTQTQTSANTRKTLTLTGIDAIQSSNIGNTLIINSFFDTNTGYGSVSFRWQLRIEDQDPVPPTDPTYYWNDTTEAWTTTPAINTQVANSVQVWEEFSYNLGNFPYTGELYLDLYEPFVQNSGGLNALYYDNIKIDYDRREGSVGEPFFASIDGFAYKRIRTTASDISGVLELKDMQLSSNNYRNTNLVNVIRPRDDNANFEKPLEQITTQQVINDYRLHLIRYEGSLYNLQKDPFGLQNKIWVNFGASVLREPVSCIIDSMTYNVKRNVYEIVMHIPNQDDDESSTFKVTF
jgi:hypothetical protein